MGILNPQCPLCKKFICEFVNDSDTKIICYNPLCSNQGNILKIKNEEE